MKVSDETDTLAGSFANAMPGPRSGFLIGGRSGSTLNGIKPFSFRGNPQTAITAGDPAPRLNAAGWASWTSPRNHARTPPGRCPRNAP
jgi:hypothetical protein